MREHHIDLWKLLNLQIWNELEKLPAPLGIAFVLDSGIVSATHLSRLLAVWLWPDTPWWHQYFRRSEFWKARRLFGAGRWGSLFAFLSHPERMPWKRFKIWWFFRRWINERYKKLFIFSKKIPPPFPHVKKNLFIGSGILYWFWRFHSFEIDEKI